MSDTVEQWPHGYPEPGSEWIGPANAPRRVVVEERSGTVYYRQRSAKYGDLLLKTRACWCATWNEWVDRKLGNHEDE